MRDSGVEIGGYRAAAARTWLLKRFDPISEGVLVWCMEVRSGFVAKSWVGNNGRRR